MRDGNQLPGPDRDHVARDRRLACRMRRAAHRRTTDDAAPDRRPAWSSSPSRPAGATWSPPSSGVPDAAAAAAAYARWPSRLIAMSRDPAGHPGLARGLAAEHGRRSDRQPPVLPAARGRRAIAQRAAPRRLVLRPPRLFGNGPVQPVVVLRPARGAIVVHGVSGRPAASRSGVTTVRPRSPARRARRGSSPPAPRAAGRAAARSGSRRGSRRPARSPACRAR